MESLSAFDAALSEGIRLQKQKQLLLGALFGVGVVMAAGLFLVDLPKPVSASSIVLIAAVAYLARSMPPRGLLDGLRGLTPEHWLPSKSHGVLAVNGDHLVSSTFSAALNRHGMPRVSSVSYDEAAHGVLVQILRERRTRRGQEDVENVRELVLLVASVTPERGFAFARILLELSQR